MWGRGNSVCIATDYGLYGYDSIPGSASFFSTASRPRLGPTQTPIQWGPGALFPSIKKPGREVDNSPASGIEIKKDGAIPPLPRKSPWYNA
jgi:hypothetical protein